MSARQDNERGAVLLTALFIMSIISVIAVGYLALTAAHIHQGRAIDRSAQADWYMKAAQDFALVTLESQREALGSQAGNVFISSGQPLVLPFENGTVTLVLEDASHCVSLAALSRNQDTQVLERWGHAFGYPQNTMQALTSRIKDWQDPDQSPDGQGAEDFSYQNAQPAFRTPDSVATAFAEILPTLIEGGPTAEELGTLLCAHDGGELKANINTMSVNDAGLLAALMGPEFTPTDIAALIESRPPEGFREESFPSNPILLDRDLGDALLNNIAYVPRLVGVHVLVNFDGNERYNYLVFALGDNSPNLIYRSRDRRAMQITEQVESESDG